MNTEIKATLYDILGYLATGIVGIAVWVLAYTHASGASFADTYEVLLKLDGTMTVLGLILLGYLLGHAISSLSCIAIEKPVQKSRAFDRYHAFERMLTADANSLFRARFKRTFGYMPSPRDFRLCMCYAESRAPTVYQTAFVFCAFYGMARNLVLVFICYGLWEMVNAVIATSWALALWATAGFSAATVFFYHYLRFVRYFRQHIVGAFIIGSQVNSKRRRATERDEQALAS